MASSRSSRRRALTRPLLSVALVAGLMFSGSAGYTVRAGETLWGIASKLGVSVSSLAAANDLGNPNVIHPGQTLRLPGGGGSAAPATATASSPNVHVVVPGETLMGISIRYGVKMRAIADANGFSDLHWVYAGQRLKIPAAGGAAEAAPAVAAAPAARHDIGRLLEQEAQRHGFSPAFVKALAYMESGWNQSARSSVGAVGVMQVLPSTGEFVSTYLVGRPLDLTRAEDNVTAGVAFLAYLWRLTGGDVDRTLAGYYQGLQSVSDNGMYPSTKHYIRTVLALRSRF